MFDKEKHLIAIDNICNLLESKGITYDNYFKEMISALTIKILEEKETTIDINNPPKGLQDLLKDNTYHLEVLKLLQGIDIKDEISNIYEYIIHKHDKSTTRKNGQHFTPSDLVDLSYRVSKELINLEDVNVVSDLSAGSGSFLKPFTKYKDLNLQAIEILDETYKLCKLNLLNSTTNIINGNTLDKSIYNQLNKSDLIIGNPPYKNHYDKELITLDNLSIKSNKLEFNFLKANADNLKDGGYSVLIFPIGLFFDKNKTNKILRDEFLKENKLIGAINLGAGLFGATDVETLLVISKKGEPTDNYWIYDLSYQRYNQGNRIAKEDEAEIFKAIKGEEINSDRYSVYEYDKSAKCLEYKSKKVIKFRPSEDILTDIQELLNEISEVM